MAITLQANYSKKLGLPGYSSHQYSVGEEQESKGVAWNLLQTYFKGSPIPPNEPAEGVEVSVEADLGTTKLIGIIDLVRSGGRIVEFKTTGL